MIPRMLLASFFLFHVGNLMGCDDATLRDTLVVRLSQSGFAGETGTIYTVESDGSWSTRAFVNERVGEMQAEGVFTDEQLNELAGMVDTEVFADGEGSTRKAPDINPQGIRIEYGDRSVALALDAADEIVACDDGAECPVTSLAVWLKARTEGDAR